MAVKTAEANRTVGGVGGPPTSCRYVALPCHLLVRRGFGKEAEKAVKRLMPCVDEA